MTEHDPSDGNVSPKPLRPSATPSGGCGGTPPDKPRSGYGRQRLRMQRLIAEHEALKEQHQQLLIDHEELLAAFDELKALNEELAADLKLSRQRRVPNLTSSLLGQPYGR